MCRKLSLDEIEVPGAALGDALPEPAPPVDRVLPQIPLAPVPAVAAVTVACILQQFTSINSPGGYLRALTRKAEDGAAERDRAQGGLG